MSAKSDIEDVMLNLFQQPEKMYYVYITASKKNGTLYVGMTNNLQRRIHEYKNNMLPGFTSRYNVTKLVYFEKIDTVIEAIAREKQLKNWHRRWKINLVESMNPNWQDLDPETSSG